MTRKKRDAGKQAAVVDATAPKTASLRPQKRASKKQEINFALHPSIDKQWEMIRSYRDDLAKKDPFVPAPRKQTRTETLERSWQATLTSGAPQFARASPGEDSDPPFVLAMMLIDAGVYPPPELLLTLRDLFHIYLDNPRKIDVERLLFGKSVQKAGSYEERLQTQALATRMAFETERFIGTLKKKSKTKALQRIAAAEAMRSDPEKNYAGLSLEQILQLAAKGRKRKRK